MFKLFFLIVEPLHEKVPVDVDPCGGGGCRSRRCCSGGHAGESEDNEGLLSITYYQFNCFVIDSTFTNTYLSL